MRDLAAALAALAMVLAAPPAVAQPEDPAAGPTAPTSPSTGPPTSLPLSPDTPAPPGAPTAPAPGATPAPGSGTAAGDPGTDPSPGGLVQALIGAGADLEDDTPSPHYSLGFSVHLLRPVDAVVATLTRLVHQIGMALVGVTLWLLGWVYRFEVGWLLAPVAGRLATAVQVRLIGGLELGHVALLLAIGWSGWMVLSHRAPRGLAELGVSLLLLAASAVVLSDPEAIVCRTLQVVGAASGQVLALADDAADVPLPAGRCARPEPQDRPSQAVAAALHRAYVHEPFLLLNWGRLDPPGTPCRDTAEALLADFHGDRDHPRDVMTAAGCGDAAAFNARPSVERLTGALLILLAIVALLWSLWAVAAALLAAQVLGAALVLLLPLALAAGVVPGLGRQLLLRWVGHAARVLLLLLATAFFLSVLVLAVRETLALAQDRSLVERYALLTAVTGGLVAGRKRLLAGAERVAVAAGRRAEAAGAGGAAALDSLPGPTIAPRGRGAVVHHVEAVRTRVAGAAAGAAALAVPAARAGVAVARAATAAGRGGAALHAAATGARSAPSGPPPRPPTSGAPPGVPGQPPARSGVGRVGWARRRTRWHPAAPDQDADASAPGAAADPQPSASDGP